MRPMLMRFIVLVGSLMLWIGSAQSAEAQAMYAGDSLKFFQVRYSQNGNYKINWFCDNFTCQLSHYQKVGSTWTFKGFIALPYINIAVIDNPAGLYMQSDGNLVVYDENWVPKWESNTTGTGATWLNIQNDGNVVLYDNNNQSWWTPRCVVNQSAYPPPTSGCP